MLSPRGLAVNLAGDLYIADSGNSRILKFSDGIVTTVAGSVKGFGGDGGPAANAELNNPTGLAFDAGGNLYIADSSNCRVRMISGGVISTVAGDGVGGFNGDNIPATSAAFNNLGGLAVDAAGNIYVTDINNDRIRKISNGIITTIAGPGTGGGGADNGDGGPAVIAELGLYEGGGVAVDAAGDVYIAAPEDSRIRLLTPGPASTGPLSIITPSLPEAYTGAFYHCQLTAINEPGSYSWSATGLPTGLTLDTTGDVTGFALIPGSFAVTVTIVSGGSSASANFTLAVFTTTPLQFTTSKLPGAVEGLAYGPLNIMAANGSGGYTFSAVGLPASLTLSASGVLSGIPTEAGSFSVTLAVSSGASTCATVLPLSVATSAAPLTIVTSSLGTGVAGQAFTRFTMQAVNGSGGYVWFAAGLPAGVSLSPAGAVSGTPTVAGSYAVTVMVTSGPETASETYSLAILSPASPIEITTSYLLNGAVGKAYGPLVLESTGGALHSSPTWSAAGLPAGMTVTTSGILTGTPAIPGLFSSTITATGGGYTASVTLPITITATPVLYIPPQSLTDGILNAPYFGGFVLALNDSGSDSWSATGLPPGIVIYTSGLLNGTPTASGIFAVTFTVTSGGSTASATLPLTVGLGPVVITTTTLLNGAVGQSYFSLVATASGGTGVYEWSAAGLPTGLSLSSAGVFSGAPTASGSFFVTLTAASGVSSAAATLALTVMAGGAAQPLQIPNGGNGSAVVLTSASVRTPYSQTLPANNGASPYSWSLLGGALPAGFTLSSSGVLAGTAVQPGAAEFTAQVRDASGATAFSVFALSIEDAVLSFGSAPAALPNGIPGSDYPPQIIAAAGGTPPYAYAIDSGLPGGLSYVGGALSGIPTASGTFTAVASASDASVPAQSALLPLHLTIQPSQADLIVSQAALAFSIGSGATGLPPGAAITVRSSSASQILNYSFAVSPAVPWLEATGGGTTPGIISLSLDPSVLSMEPGVSNTSIVVTCIAPSPCAGNAQTIGVSLTVTAPTPILSAAPSALSFTAPASAAQTLSQNLVIQNVGGGVIGVNSIAAVNGFVTLSEIPSTIGAGSPAYITVTVNPAGQTPGFHRTSVVVDTSAGSIGIPVSLLVTQNPIVKLNPAGKQFRASAGLLPGDPAGSFIVTASGSSAVNWTATLLPGAPWLTVNTAEGTATSGQPATVNYSVNPAATTLSPGTYYAAVQVASQITASQAGSPLTFVVVLNVTPAGAPVAPQPEPAALLFMADGIGNIPSQNVRVFASAAAPQIYQASSDSFWLSVSPASGSISSTAPATSVISVNSLGLSPGVHRGYVSYAISSAAVPAVSVTVIVGNASCAPSQLVPRQTGLLNNFIQAAGGPAPLGVVLVDDCGQPVNGALVTATFSNGDPPLSLIPVDTTTGTYMATWTPGSIGQQVAVTVAASAADFPPATVQTPGTITPATAPVLNPNGTLDAFAVFPEPGVPLAPGTIVQIYGSNLAAQTSQASAIPLPTSLNNTSVTIGGLPAPLYYVSPGQINAQVPFELPAGAIDQVYVNANGALSMPVPILLTADAPGIAQQASGQIIAQHQNGSMVSETSPAAPGEYLVLYVSGMGLTNQAVASGTASPSGNLAKALDQPTLTLNGAAIGNVSYAGLTPTLVGLYQVDFQVPVNVPDGDLQLTMTQASGVTSSAVLPVHDQ